MRKFLLTSVILTFFATLSACSAHADDIKSSFQGWGHNSSAFAECSEYIADSHEINILAFDDTKLVVSEGVEVPQYLVDGTGGEYGGTGRVAINGAPSRLVYYLGKPCKIMTLNVFSGNIDERGNQDFEIRLANNASNPGVMPKFSDEPTITSGNKVLGNNGGAFVSSYSSESEGPLFDQEFDWIEFRFWRTYKVRAGEPAKENSQATSWGSLIELQALGDPNDPTLFKSEEARQQWLAQIKARKLRNELRKLGPDVAYSVEHRDSLELAIEAALDNWGDELGDVDWEERFDEFEEKFASSSEMPTEDYLELVKDYDAFRREVLLSHPSLAEFDKILLRKTTNPALMANWISNASRGKGKYDDSLVLLNMRDLDAPLETVARGPNESFIGDINLHWDADRCLVTCLSDAKTWQIFECDLEDGSLRQVTPEMGDDVNNVEGCYVPDGSTIFISSASMMGVPCISGSDVVGNIYRLEADGKTVRQLTFEQDQDWNPTILPNGRIMYLRWEYVDITHYYSRYVFTMNPDGTNQVEHYGSGSYWPNSTFYAKAFPGQSSKFVGIVSGHHGVAREGELVIFDPAKGRQETQGVVQRIPGRDNPPENVTIDQLVDNSWPKFLFPYPIDDEHILVSCRMTPGDPWGIYLVDVYDNMTLLRTEPDYQLLEPFALIEREEPQTLTDRVIPGEKTANVFITDVYFGQGLPKVPRGTVKKLRVCAVSYGYRGIGGHDVFGLESCWDGRRILGDATVNEDGSANFKIPANTPVFVQPLDEDGAAVQLMRSWFVGMPGENESCIGCHETQNDVSPSVSTIARNEQPQELEPFNGPERPFTFLAEVQPVLDKYCVGCHDGEEPDRPNFADITPGPGNFSNSYHALARYVRRPGPESDVHVLQPLEYHVSTSELVKMLRKGHYNVKLDRQSQELLFSWIDLNVPFFGTWSEIAQGGRARDSNPIEPVSSRYVELKSLYADNDLNFESDAYYWERRPERPEFVEPEETPEPDRSAPEVENWPFDASTARAMQVESAAANDAAETDAPFGITVETETKARVSLTDDLSFELVRIPSGSFVMGDEDGFLDELPRTAVTIEKPFWMATTETTNAIYNLFDSTHNSRYIDQWWKDHVLPGYPANLPDQPVIRISWQEATDFCKWLSEKTGFKFRLPTEAEWEWAARAGSSTPMWFGDLDVDFGKYENLSDRQTKKFVVQGVNPQPISNPPEWRAFIPRIDSVDDGNMIATDVGSYLPNPWGLHDMLGNVAEWTSSDYKPYPYDATDGRNSGDVEAKKVARGGSWRDRPKWARAGVRGEYESWQRVFNVGFRVVCEDLN
ncbi:MAG: SUMF1/EgtB/PvdO family nonheme iron enzyme [Thermoguttaceae bacterium]|jgi:formylglycine-generating enzyme required for sulfatase activity